MNPAAAHLALNVFPPVLNIAALVVFALAMLWRSVPVLRAALILLLFSGLMAIPVYLTGEPAEELVEGMDGVNRVSIHPHEEAAEFAFIALCVQGVAALAALVWFRRREPANWMVVVTLLIAISASGAVFRAAYLGGKIRHPETRMAR